MPIVVVVRESEQETVVDGDFDSIVELASDEAKIKIEEEIILSATILPTQMSPVRRMSPVTLDLSSPKKLNLDTEWHGIAIDLQNGKEDLKMTKE